MESGQPPVVAAIYADTDDPRVQSSMMLGSLLEGGNWTGPWSPGDQGTSLGPFQIHLPAHPGVTAAEAEDPAFAVSYMLPEYQTAAAKVPASLWSSDPELAAERTAYYAERPAQDYVASRGQSTVDSAWTKVTAGRGGAFDTTGSGVQLAGFSPTGVASSVGGKILDFLGVPSPSDVLHIVERLALGALGGLVILVGVFVTMRGSAGGYGEDAMLAVPGVGETVGAARSANAKARTRTRQASMRRQARGGKRFRPKPEAEPAA